MSENLWFFDDINYIVQCVNLSCYYFKLCGQNSEQSTMSSKISWLSCDLKVDDVCLLLQLDMCELIWNKRKIVLVSGDFDEIGNWSCDVFIKCDWEFLWMVSLIFV